MFLSFFNFGCTRTIKKNKTINKKDDPLQRINDQDIAASAGQSDSVGCHFNWRMERVILLGLVCSTAAIWTAASGVQLSVVEMSFERNLRSSTMSYLVLKWLPVPRFEMTYNIIDRWRSKTSENPIYENWKQCQSHDPAIWLVAGDVCSSSIYHIVW